jgi:hypothetical protein
MDFFEVTLTCPPFILKVMTKIRTNHPPEISKILEDIQEQAETAAIKAAEWSIAECKYEGDKYNQYIDLLLKDSFGLLYQKYTNKIYRLGTYSQVNTKNKYTLK